jgi:arabinofuranan 3-O-arabinosyltransferase
VQTAVRARLSDLLDLVPVPASPCVDDVSMPAGEHRITLAPSGLFVSMGLRLTPGDDTDRSSSPEARRREEVVSWGRTDRTVRVGPGEASLLTLPENASDGWTARLDGRELTSVVVDGWRQAWLVPAGDGGDVHIEYGPRRPFLLFLWIGALGVLSVVALAVWPQGRSGSPCNEERVPGQAMHLAAAAFAGLVAGLAGLALWAVVLVVRRRASLAAIAMLAVVASGFLGVLHPGSQPWTEQGVFSAPAQILAILALVAVAEAGTRLPRPGATGARETSGGGAQRPP